MPICSKSIALVALTFLIQTGAAHAVTVFQEDSESLSSLLTVNSSDKVREAIGHIAAGNVGAAIAELTVLDQAGQTDATFFLGYFHQLGLGMPKSQDRAIELYERAIKGGHNLAKVNLARAFLFSPKPTPEQAQRAAELLLQAAPSTPQAAVTLGHLEAFGVGRPKDFSKAKEWFNKAAEAGSAEGNFNLAHLYRGSMGFPEKRDVNQAVVHLDRAAKADYEKAVFLLAQVLCEGEGVLTNRREALRVIDEFVQKKKSPGVAVRAANVCETLQPPDLAAAQRYLRFAAEKGYLDGQNFLGMHLRRYSTGEADLKEAAEWFRKAAEKQNVAAMLNFADVCRLGLGVAKDNNLARELARGALRLGNPGGALALALTYQATPDTADASPPKLVALARWAKAHGVPKAAEVADAAAKDLSPEALASGEKWLADFFRALQTATPLN
ncbi:MAG: tetratricopeptide repeat protein [Roseimicrobium sp.]